MHLVQRAAGFGGLVVLKALVFVATIGILLATLVRERRVPLTLAVFSLALVVEAVAFRFHERPQTFAFCGTVAAVWLIERRRAGRGPLWPLVPLCFVLANLHRGALLVPVLAAAYTLSLTFQRPIERRQLLSTGMIAAAAGLACLLTPSGLDMVTSSFRMLQEPGFRDQIPEWFTPTPLHVWRAAPATYGVVALALLGMVLRGRRQDPWDVILTLLAVLVGVRAVRFLPLFALLAVGPAASGVALAAQIWRSRVGMLIGAAAAAVGLLFALVSDLPAPHVGLQPRRFPDAALAFVRDHGVRGRVINDFRFGGYLLFADYPTRKVYVDGRNDVVYPLAFLRTATTVFRAPELLATEQLRWNAQWLLVPNEPDVRSRAHIDYDPAWTLVFASEVALVYVLTDGDNQRLAQDYGYRLLAAHDLQATLVTAIGSGSPKLAEAAREEARRMVREDQESHPAHLALALAYRLSGPAYVDQMAAELSIVEALGRRR